MRNTKEGLRLNIEAIPPCQGACPIYTDVRGYVSAIARGNIEEAIRIIREVNPLPSVCGRICTRPCETACRRAQIDEPIAVRALKRFAAEKTKGLKLIEQPNHYYDERVAVIGGGVAGLTAAYDLTLLGYRVTVFEAEDIPGGMLTYGISDYRLPKDVVKEELDFILSLGIEVKTNIALGRDISIEGLLKDYQAIFLATGSQRSLLPKCKGIELSGIIKGVEFLKQVSRGQRPLLGEEVVVIGGGHTATDVARTCIRLGTSKVTIIYRRTLDEMPAAEEVKNAESEGVKIMYLTAPIEFLGNGSVKKVRCIKMRLGEIDSSGRPRPVPIENSEFEIDASTVILAIGYIPQKEELSGSGLILSENGTVVVDKTGQTHIKGVFAGGDVVSGPSSVIEAIASGKRAAQTIHRYLRNLPYKEFERLSTIGLLEDGVIKLTNKLPRQEMPTIPIKERINSFTEVELGYNLGQALREAQRCLNCGAGAIITEGCVACLNCIRICPYRVAVIGKEIAEIDISQCQACGICVSECPALAIDLRLESKEKVRATLKRIINTAKQEAPEILITGFYCQYGLPAGPPNCGGDVYWLGSLCTGRLDVFQLIYPFELGADGVAVHMCENEECRFRDGSRWLVSRIGRAKKMLDEIGLCSERLNIISQGEEIFEFKKRLKSLGINPINR